MKVFDVVVVGGGTAGITTAARLKRAAGNLNIAVIEPSGNHFHQPSFTFIATGLEQPHLGKRAMSEVIPTGCHWVRDALTHVDAENNTIQLSSGEFLGYRVLVVAPGLTLDVESVSGLGESLSDRTNPVCSIYDSSNLDKCRTLLSQFTGGLMLFSMPSGPIKCASAPFKIINLIDDQLRKSGVREVSRIVFITPYPGFFGLPGYEQTVVENAKRRGIELLQEHEVTKIDARNRQVLLTPVSEIAAARNIRNVRYDFAHITPRMRAPSFIRDSQLHHGEGTQSDWLLVDPFTLQHPRFLNIFGLGDVAGLPTMKSASAAIKQAEVVALNILSLFKAGKAHSLPARYNGYTSCPLYLGIGKSLEAEIGYEGQLLPSLPGSPFSPSRVSWILNRYIRPKIYWNKTLKGL